MTNHSSEASGKVTDDVITELSGVLEAGDLVIDGDETRWLDPELFGEVFS